MVHRHSKWRIALIASLSMILSSTATSTEKQGRILLGHQTSKDSAVNSIRKSSAASALKTDFGDQEEVAGNGKTIDYTLYNYGGSAVLSLTKDKTNALNFNDTQASTIAALGNAALILGGALLFGQLNNRIQEKASYNLYSRGFKGHPMGMVPPPPVPTFRKRRLRNRFRKRRLPAYVRTAYSQRHGRLPVGGRRRLRKNFQTRAQRPGLRTGGGLLQNHRLNSDYAATYPGAMTRDQVSVPLRDETPQRATYKSDASVLDPIKPMNYDPYLQYEGGSQYEDQPMMEDYYYDDYYDAGLPNFSALKGETPSNQIQTRELPSLTKKQAEIKTQKPVLKNDVFTESRIPTRNEMLLKMSEEKRLEKLQKERAKLLEATLMRPEEMVKPGQQLEQTTTSEPNYGFSEPNYGFAPESAKPQEKVRTRARIPLKRQRQRQSPPQEIDSFDSPRIAFQTNFARPTPAVLNPVANVNAKNAEGAPAGAGQDQSFYNNFQAQENDPFQDIASDFRKPAQWAAKSNQVRRRRLSNGRKKRLRFRDFDYY